jgi:hypothetical protein
MIFMFYNNKSGLQAILVPQEQNDGQLKKVTTKDWLSVATQLMKS